MRLLHTLPRLPSLPLEEAEGLRQEVVEENLEAFRKKLREKRRAANRKYLDGGAPRTEEMWPEGDAAPESLLYGKLLLTQVTHKAQRAKSPRQRFEP